MTPAEIAALRERLAASIPGLFSGSRKCKYTTVSIADLTSALALLDAQAAEIARLTAEREQMRAEIAAAHRMYDAACDTIRALAPAPAAEVE